MSRKHGDGGHTATDDTDMGKHDGHVSATESPQEAGILTEVPSHVHEDILQSLEATTHEEATDSQMKFNGSGDGKHDGQDIMSSATAEPDNSAATSNSPAEEVSVPHNREPSVPAVAGPEDVEPDDLTAQFSRLLQDAPHHDPLGCAICGHSESCHCPAFAPYEAQDDLAITARDQICHFQSITSQHEYQAHSFEEIRLANYRMGKTFHDTKEYEVLTNPSIIALEEAADLLCATIFDNHLAVTRFDVGPDRVPFYVHDQLLEDRQCHDFKQRVDKLACHIENVTVDCWRVELEHEDVSTFHLFLGWLYIGQIIPLRMDDAQWQKSLELDTTNRIVPAKARRPRDNFVYDDDLARLFVFAAREGVQSLANAAVTCLMVRNARLGQTTTKKVIELLFAAPREEAGSFCDLLVEDAAMRLSEKVVSARTMAFPVAYVTAIMKHLLKDRDEGNIEKLSKNERRRRICAPHVHATEQEAAACRKSLTDRQAMDIAARKKPGPDLHKPYSSTATIVVGRERLKFIVHKGLICKHSGYFRGAFKAGFAEAGKTRLNCQKSLSLTLPCSCDGSMLAQWTCPTTMRYRTMMTSLSKCGNVSLKP